jgi:molecular chaperone GrpE
MIRKTDTEKKRRKIEIVDGNDLPDSSSASESGNGEQEDSEFRFEDRRRWAHPEEEPADEVAPRAPSLIEEYRERTEAAERKLQEYIEAFKGFKKEQDEFRSRLSRDVERRVDLQFGGLVEELLEAMDNLDLALEHVNEVPEAEALARGVELARKRFLEALERLGVEKIDPEGDEFDPNEAEAMRVDPVPDPEMSGRVTNVLRPGYRLRDRVIRPARVAVGRHD